MKDIIIENKGDYQTLKQVFEGVVEIRGGCRKIHQSISIQRHIPTCRIKWFLVKEIYDNGKQKDFLYVRCHHDTKDQLTFFEYLKRYKDSPDERFRAELIYQDKQVVGYRDDGGNEWKKEWTPKNPFDIEKKTQRYYHVAHTAIRFWQTNTFFYMGIGGKIRYEEQVIPTTPTIAWE